jgi:hypothetical protein
MATTRVLQESQREDFQVVRDLGPETLQRVVGRLRQLEPAPVRPDQLGHAIAEVLGGNTDAAESVVRQALMIYGWIRPGGLQVAEVQEGIRDALKADFNWTDQEIEKWQRIEPALGDLLSLPILRLVASSIDLSYEYANLWRGARILTDIRPIFNEEATAIDGAVVSHTFRLLFEGLDGRHELNVAMDESDIKKLAEQCDRALRKGQTARALMRDNAKVPTMISGESDNA